MFEMIQNLTAFKGFIEPQICFNESKSQDEFNLPAFNLAPVYFDLYREKRSAPTFSAKNLKLRPKKSETNLFSGLTQFIKPIFPTKPKSAKPNNYRIKDSKTKHKNQNLDFKLISSLKNKPKIKVEKSSNRLNPVKISKSNSRLNSKPVSKLNSKPKPRLKSRPVSKLDSKPKPRLNSRPVSKLDSKPKPRLKSRPVSKLNSKSKPRLKTAGEKSDSRKNTFVCLK